MSTAARHTVRAGRLRLVRFAGTKVFTYSSPVHGQVNTRRAGVTTVKKEC
ncbi:hypothetical protein HUN42_00076 [Streptomyces phage Dagobah]|nr:hypothetical protein HUN42_00076 [Streptomyces phage Dagobah]